MVKRYQKYTVLLKVDLKKFRSFWVTIKILFYKIWLRKFSKFFKFGYLLIPFSNCKNVRLLAFVK
jgi:hypothetical protein